MAEEKGKVLLIGKSWSGRTTLANMLVSGELKDCPLEPTDTDSICKTYVGRGWTVIDTMGFGTEPLGGVLPEEYARKMVYDFLEEVKGRYSHIIFVVDGRDILRRRDDKSTMSIMWQTFLEIFKGSEENFVVLVTKVSLSMSVRTREEIEAMRTREEIQVMRINRRHEDISFIEVPSMFPECNQFLHADFLKSPIVSKDSEDSDVSEATLEEGMAKRRQEELERLEKEMKEMFKGNPWVEPDISRVGDEEIKEMAAKITRQLTSSRPGKARSWGPGPGSAYEHVIFYSRLAQSDAQVLEGKASMVVDIRDEMQNLGKKVKFYQRQCEYLLQRSVAASKTIHDLFAGTGMDWNERHLKRFVRRLIKSLDKLICSMTAGKELLHLCGDSEVEQEVALTLSPPGSGTNSFSKFARVLCDLDWSLDAFRFLFHNPEVVHATQSEGQSWLSKFMWCEARCRLVYMGDGENEVADADLVESCVAADNDRHAQDQQDLISSMESHFSTLEKPSNVQNKLFGFRNFLSKRKKTKKQLCRSEMSSYMSILKNRLQGDSSFEGPNTVPGCYWIPGNQEFKSIQFIGGGSYKEVQKCEWLGMNVAVATSQGDQGGPSRTVFETEAGVLARVQHPNVVSFIGCTYDEEKNQGSLVTELMEASLRSLIDCGNHGRDKTSYPFTISGSIDILLQIVEAMIHVHECGVMHRDLKADNLLANRAFDAYGGGLYVTVVKLVDFGTSKLRSAEMGSNFKTQNVGTRAWMAPEVIRKGGDEKKLYTMSADVYSFGMTCYEILTGDRPFQSYMGCVLREMICAGHRPPIPDNCPEDLMELMTKCWAHNPEDRPTFKDIRQKLWNLKLYYTIWET